MGARAVDERFNVSGKVQQVTWGGFELAQGIDSRFTGGRVAPAVQSAYDQGLQLALGGLSFLAAGYEIAKQERLVGGAQRAEDSGNAIATADSNATTPSAADVTGGM